MQKYLNDWPWGLKAMAGSALGCPPGSTAVFNPRPPRGEILNCPQTVPFKWNSSDSFRDYLYFSFPKTVKNNKKQTKKQQTGSMTKALFKKGTKKQRNLWIIWSFNPKSHLWKVAKVFLLCVFFILYPALRSLCGTVKSWNEQNQDAFSKRTKQQQQQ